jgi:signal transduction histidine kinase/CheY-like chemotaxis protein/CHASE3 domain sensor protein
MNIMKIKNIKIRSLLVISLIISVFLVLTLGIFSIQQNNKLQQQIETFFNHPYQVRLAIGKINAEIQYLRLIQRDLFLNLAPEKNAENLEVIYEDIHTQFDILKAQYLGDKDDIVKAFNSYLKWKTAITESMDKAKSGQKENAVNELTSNGKIRILKDEMIDNINVIDKFAFNKAVSLNTEANDYADSSNIKLMIVICIFILVSIISNIILFRTIRKPIKELIKATELFHNGKLEARTTYHLKNEFGVLSDSWNTMAESIQIKSEIDEKFAHLASLILSEYDLNTFFRTTLSAMASNTNSQIAAIYFLSNDKKNFIHFESIGLENTARQSFAADTSEGEFGAVIQSRKVQHLKNIPENTRFVFHTVSGKFIPREIITLPIIVDNEVTAVISMATINNYSEAALLFINRIHLTLNVRIEGLLAFHKTKEYAEKLNQQNCELEAQKTELELQSSVLTEQNTELEMQKKQLSEASNLKTNFLSNMSHELRTPLNSVIALSGVLNRRLANQIPAEEYSYLDVIERNGKHLLELINDILDISRIEAGREEYEITSFNINSLIAEIISTLKPQAVQKNIKLLHINPETLLIITNDAGKCRHILQNLIGNAVKFTEIGKVEITAIQNGESIIIRIADTGIGIAANHLPHIFDEFRQADGSTSRRFGGTGLGLAIAQKYAHLLGGSISVDSILNKGSEFTLTLPLHYAAENRITVSKTQENFTKSILQQKHNAPEDTTEKTVLLVEDSDAAIIQLKDMLEDKGYHLLIASNGREALDILPQTIPDAIILDLMMPGIDGFEVLKNVRENEASACIPVLILTAKHITKEELSFLKSNNIHQLIQKGNINRSELQNAVAEMVFTETTKPVSEIRNIEGKPLVLVVENNPDNMITARAVLANNFEVIEAIDAVIGIEMAKKYHPNLILMDIGLPGMDGIEAFKIIRSDTNLQHIPVIALTASAMIADRETILAHGFDAYIPKPIDENLFFKTINKTLYGE